MSEQFADIIKTTGERQFAMLSGRINYTAS